MEKAPKKYQAGLRLELGAMFHCASIKEARKKLASILQDYADIAPDAMECLYSGFESAVTVLYLLKLVHRLICTSNHIERLNRELKRRSTAIGVFPNGESVIRLMGALLLEHHEKLQGQRRLIYQPSFIEINSKAELLKQIAHE